SYFVAYKIRGNVSFLKSFEWTVAKQLLKDSWPLIITGLSVVIFMQIDKVMIKELLGGYEVGLYTAGVKFPEAVGFLPMFLATSLFPAILNSRNNSEKLYRQRLQKFYFSMTWIAIALVVFFVMVSDVLVGFYGYQYLAANDVLIV